MVKIKKVTSEDDKEQNQEKRNFKVDTQATGRIIKAQENANKVLEK